jgi:hypothetical protein
VPKEIGNEKIMTAITREESFCVALCVAAHSSIVCDFLVLSIDIHCLSFTKSKLHDHATMFFPQHPKVPIYFYEHPMKIDDSG